MATLARYPDEALPQERIPTNSRWGIWLSTLQRLLNAAAHFGASVTLAAGTKTVIFDHDHTQPDANYQISLSWDANETIRWGTKTASGFVLTSSNAGSTANVDYVITRV